MHCIVRSMAVMHSSPRVRSTKLTLSSFQLTTEIAMYLTEERNRKRVLSTQTVILLLIIGRLHKDEDY